MQTIQPRTSLHPSALLLPALGYVHLCFDSFALVSCPFLFHGGMGLKSHRRGVKLAWGIWLLPGSGPKWGDKGLKPLVACYIWWHSAVLLRLTKMGTSGCQKRGRLETSLWLTELRLKATLKVLRKLQEEWQEMTTWTRGMTRKGVSVGSILLEVDR